MQNAGMWQAYRAMTADRSVKNTRLTRGTVKRVMGYAAEFKGLIIVFLTILVLDSLMVIAQPLLFKRIVDIGIPNKDARMVTFTALIIATLSIVDAGVNVLTRRMQSRIGEGLIYNLRSEVFDHVQRQSIAFFTRAQTGALISRLNSDVLGAQRAFTSTLGGIVGNAISLSVVVATMFALSWQITVAALFMIPLFLLPARYMGRTLQSMTREQSDLNAVMSTQMAERFNVSGALLMKLFGKPARETQMFSERAIKVRDIGINIATANSAFMTAMMLVSSLATALVYGIGGNNVVSGTLSLGTLLALVALIARLYVPMATLANVRVDVMTALVSFERVFEVLDLDPMVKDAPHAITLERGPAGISFEHVGFRYPNASEVSLASLEVIARPDSGVANEPVLTDVSFEAQAGQLVALVGPSGAGKTTLTSLVSRLFDPIDGVIKIRGIDIREVTQDSLHDVVGVVTQDSHMYHDSIRANLLYANPQASDDDMWAACEDAQIAHMIRELPDQLDTVVGDRGYRLSGGEKQRLSIARMLLKAPDIVVLDEATAHLDSENESALQAALATALRGRTSLVIAHRLSTIRQADVILVLENGQIVQQGTHEELLGRGGLYADLYNRQFADSAD